MVGKPIRFILGLVVNGLYVLFVFEYGVTADSLFDSGENRRSAKCDTLARNFSIILSL